MQPASRAASRKSASSPTISLCLSVPGKCHAFNYECRRSHPEVSIDIGGGSHIEEHILEVRSNRYFADRIGKPTIFDPEARCTAAILASDHVHALPKHLSHVK